MERQVKHQDHITAGLSDPCEADIVRIIVEASKQELNRLIKKKEPPTADLMKLLFLKFNKVNRTLKELRLLYVPYRIPDFYGMMS